MIIDGDGIELVYKQIKADAQRANGVQTVQILVSPEVDSLCALKIFTVFSFNFSVGTT